MDDVLFTGKRHESIIKGDIYFDKSTLKFKFYDVEEALDAGYCYDVST